MLNSKIVILKIYKNTEQIYKKRSELLNLQLGDLPINHNAKVAENIRKLGDPKIPQRVTNEGL